MSVCNSRFHSIASTVLRSGRRAAPSWRMWSKRYRRRRFEDSEASALKLRIPILVLAWFMADGVLPAQNQTVVLTTKARLDFEKVDAEPIPAVADTMTCVQSHAAALPVTRLE